MLTRALIMYLGENRWHETVEPGAHEYDCGGDTTRICKAKCCTGTASVSVPEGYAIQKNTGIPFSEFATLKKPSNLSYMISNGNDLVYVEDLFKLINDNGYCIFNEGGEDGKSFSCRIYEFRPQICRVHPSARLEKDGKIQKIVQTNDCKGFMKSQTPMSIAEVDQFNDTFRANLITKGLIYFPVNPVSLNQREELTREILGLFGMSPDNPTKGDLYDLERGLVEHTNLTELLQEYEMSREQFLNTVIGNNSRNQLVVVSPVLQH